MREVRGLGLMWAIEFTEPRRGGRTYRFLERRQPGVFAQLVVVPLFSRHHILTQVAGHGLNVSAALPPLDAFRRTTSTRFCQQALDDAIAAPRRRRARALMARSAASRAACRRWQAERCSHERCGDWRGRVRPPRATAEGS